MDKDMSGRVDEFELTHFLTTLFCSEGKKLGDAEVRQIELMIAGLDEDGTYI
jgi:Ca2+-binding EF-hand superfamily protein